MEDGNFSIGKEDNNIAACIGNTYGERPSKLTANGHDVGGESSIAGGEGHHPYRTSAGASLDDKYRRRINPLRIHLGKRPFVDNSLQHHSTIKKKKTFVVKPSDASIPINPRVPKLIPKRIDHSHFHHAVSNPINILDSERDKPVPRLVPKSQVLQFKKGKTEKAPQLKEYAQSLGLQPMVKFKCRKCCSMSFKTLGMLKEHQLVCRAQAKEPALSPEAAPTAETNASGPSRVTRKVYLCSACGTYYENWNLFLHMREVHNRHICLFCLGMFSKAEKLSAHLTNKHNVQEFNYESKEDFFSVYSGTLYLMCCSCDEICSEKDDFFNHDCNNVKPKPVPVLISKNAVKSHTTKHASKLNSEMALNSPAYKEIPKPLLERKNVLDRLEVQIPKHPINSAASGTVVSDESISSDNSIATTKDTSNTVDSGMELESLNGKSVSSYQTSLSPDRNKALPNGDESMEHSDGNESSVSDDIPSPDLHPSTVPEDLEKPIIRPPIEREKGGGIKLKLSLNNANSPVIINSTVDPTVGKKNLYKPPSRSRRPPKRYEKVKTPETSTLPRTPSIKIKICESADSPFVKTTIFEDNQEISVRTLFNNNLENLTKSPKSKPESTVKTTIYDNKMDEELNTMNRVPKLTVRVPKELLDKDSSSDYSSDSDVSDKLTVDENNTTIEEPEQNITIDESVKTVMAPLPPTQSPCYKPPNDFEADNCPLKEEITEPEAKPDIIKSEPSSDTMELIKTEEEIKPELPTEPPIYTVPAIELTLDRPLDKYPLKELLKVFLAATSENCIYCNHVRKIAVNCEQLSLHMVAEHRFSATVDSITAEELMPETIAAKVKSGAEELCSVYINFSTYDSVDKCEDAFYDHIFECFQCYFKSPVHKELYLHNRKMHQKTILLCVMCKSNFYSYSELLCHLCPGTYNAESEIKFRCCLCTVDSIPSSFRLMVHLRKIHHTCDVCLEFCHNQARLSNHVWKHKLHHLCYRCGIAYRNKQDIANHLFWKHGTESALCKRCLQKKWPHVYHFCTPPPVFVCDECSLQFTKAVYLKVHKRFHSKEYPHLCTEEGCDEKFVSKKLLDTHTNEHKVKMFLEDFKEEFPATKDIPVEVSKEPIPVIDLVADKPNEEAGPSEIKAEAGTEQLSKKAKKKKNKDKDALLLDVNLPALDLSESDSSDDSDVEKLPVEKKIDENTDELKAEPTLFENSSVVNASDPVQPLTLLEDKAQVAEQDIPSEQQVLDIWDNFKKYQAKVEKQKEKTPPLVPIRKHVCESDHDYCIIPTDLNGDEDLFSADKKKNKKSPKKRRGGLSSSSDSSSSDSSCSCGSNCSCSSSSGSSSSSSSDSDSSDESGNEKPVKIKQPKRKSLPNRRLSNGSNVDVMGMTETPVLIPEKTEPPIAEADLDTDESATDEEFYDEHPQRIANKLYAEKRNQLMLLASVAPSDGGSISGEPSRCTTPVKEEKPTKIEPEKEKPPSSKKKSKKKKKSKSSKKQQQQQHQPIKINIPKEFITKSEPDLPQPPLLPNKITISLQSNTVQIPDVAKPTTATVVTSTTPASAGEKKRASKRRRVPNKFYGYSSDEEGSPQTPAVLKPQQPPKLEWRKEDLPSPVTHKAKKEMPTSIIPQRLFNYTESIRLTAPIPDPEPPRILMNTESMDSSDSDSSDEGGLEIYQPAMQQQAPLPPTYLNSGTSSLPYAFQRPPVRQAREGESVYCYCRCPYDEVSEMIACDAEGCPIEWFHFECVGIMVPPKGKWYCPECRKNQSFSGYR